MGWHAHHAEDFSGLLLGQSSQEQSTNISYMDPPELSTAAVLPTVLNDLLYAFLGLDGKYVRARLVPAPSTAPPGTGPALAFVLAPGCEPCLAELVQRVLPIW